MKKVLLTGVLVSILLVVLVLSGCQKGWTEKHSVEIGKNDAELKAVVQHFVMGEEQDTEEMIASIESNKAYAEGDFLAYLNMLIDYNTRVKNAADKFRGRYTESCLEHLSETGCENLLREMEATFTLPAENVQEMEVIDETEDKASVRLVSTMPGSKSARVETYYLRDTDDGWKVYDVFDYNTKKAISDVPAEDIKSQQDLQIFRLRSKLKKMGFPAKDFEADKCIYALTQDYVFTSETNKEALDCYKTEYFDKSRADYSVCSDIFPNRYKAICQGIALANNGGNCTMILKRGAYRSPTYGPLTTMDICNFYYSMEMGAKNKALAKKNCLNIQSPKYKAKCWAVFEPKPAAEA